MTTLISGSMYPKVKETYLEFIKQHEDVFARTYLKMPGLKPTVATHHLTIEQDKFSVKRPWGICTLTSLLKYEVIS